MHTILEWNIFLIAQPWRATLNISFAFIFVRKTDESILKSEIEPWMCRRGMIRIRNFLLTYPLSYWNFHSVQPPFLLGRKGGLNLLPNFHKGGLDRTSIFREGLLGKSGVTFSGGQGVLQFLYKNKLKSERFNDKERV